MWTLLRRNLPGLSAYRPPVRAIHPLFTPPEALQETSAEYGDHQEGKESNENKDETEEEKQEEEDEEEEDKEEEEEEDKLQHKGKSSVVEPSSKTTVTNLIQPLKSPSIIKSKTSERRYFLHYYLNGNKWYEIRGNPAAGVGDVVAFFHTKSVPTAVYPNPFFEHVLVCLDNYLRESHTLEIKRANDSQTFHSKVAGFKTPNVVTTKRVLMGKWTSRLGSEIWHDVRSVIEYVVSGSWDPAGFLNTHFPFHGPLNIFPPLHLGSACVFCRVSPASVGIEMYGERIMCASCFQVKSAEAAADVADPVATYYAVCTYCPALPSSTGPSTCEMPATKRRDLPHKDFEVVTSFPVSPHHTHIHRRHQYRQDMGYRDSALYPCPVIGMVKDDGVVNFMMKTSACIQMIVYGDWYLGRGGGDDRERQHAPCPICGEFDSVFLSYPCMHEVGCAYCYCNYVLCCRGMDIPRCRQCNFTYCKAVYVHKYALLCDKVPGNERLRCLATRGGVGGGGGGGREQSFKRTLLSILPHQRTWGTADADVSATEGAGRRVATKQVWGWMRVIATMRWLQEPDTYAYPLVPRLRLSLPSSLPTQPTHDDEDAVPNIHLGYLIPVKNNVWVPRLVSQDTVRIFTRSGSRYLDLNIDKLVHLLALLNAAYAKCAAVLTNSQESPLIDSKMAPWIENPLCSCTPDDTTLNTLAYYAKYPAFGTLPAAICGSLLNMHDNMDWSTLANVSLFSNAAVVGSLYRRFVTKIRKMVYRENIYLTRQQQHAGGGEEVLYEGDGPRISEVNLTLSFGSKDESMRAFPANANVIDMYINGGVVHSSTSDHVMEQRDDRERDRLLTYLEIANEHLPKYRCVSERPDGTFSVNGVVTFTTTATENVKTKTAEMDKKRRATSEPTPPPPARKRPPTSWDWYSYYQQSRGGYVEKEEDEEEQEEEKEDDEKVRDEDQRKGKWSTHSVSDWLSLFVHFVFLSDEYACKRDGDTHAQVFSNGQMVLNRLAMPVVGKALAKLLLCICNGDRDVCARVMAYVFSADDVRDQMNALKTCMQQRRRVMQPQHRFDRTLERIRLLLDTVKICAMLSGYYVIPQLDSFLSHTEIGDINRDQRHCSKALARAVALTVEKMRNDNTGGMYSGASATDAAQYLSPRGDDEDDECSGDEIDTREFEIVALSDGSKLDAVIRDVFAQVVPVEDMTEELKQEILNICNECNKVALLTILETHHVNLVK